MVMKTMLDRAIGMIAGLAAMAMAHPAAAQAPAQPAPPPGMVAGAPAATPGPAPASADAPVADAGYVLGPDDVVEVSVVGRQDYRARVRVQTDGTIQLPLIGNVKVTGQTALQLRQTVGRALKSGGYFANPAVNVDIVTYSSRYVTVLGEVGNPGLVPIDRAYRVSEILARVGGVRGSAADIIQVRRVDGKEEQLAVVALATGGPTEDPIVNPGDKLFVPVAKTYYIYGQVASPGIFKLEPDMSLRKAIARSGGLTPSGSEKRVKLYRDSNEIKKFGLNDQIQPGDVIVIGERFF